MSYSEALEQQVGLLRRYQHWEGNSGWEGNAVRVLKQADTYFINGNISEGIWFAGNQLSSWSLSLRDLPGPSGFVWFERPKAFAAEDVTPGGGPSIQQLKAVSWALAHPTRSLIRVDEATSIVACTFVGASDSGNLVALHRSSWLFGESVDAAPWIERGGKEATWNHLDSKLTDGVMRFLAGFFLFIRQNLLSASHQLAERHARKRLERDGFTQTPLIRVVQLRRKEYLGGKQPVERVEREWSCQWVVRGHWRQQFYPSKHANQSIWITPYVKGPDDKPLKPPRATVFAVVR